MKLPIIISCVAISTSLYANTVWEQLNWEFNMNSDLDRTRWVPDVSNDIEVNGTEMALKLSSYKTDANAIKSLNLSRSFTTATETPLSSDIGYVILTREYDESFMKDANNNKYLPSEANDIDFIFNCVCISFIGG